MYSFSCYIRWAWLKRSFVTKYANRMRLYSKLSRARRKPLVLLPRVSQCIVLNSAERRCLAIFLGIKTHAAFSDTGDLGRNHRGKVYGLMSDQLLDAHYAADFRTINRIPGEAPFSTALPSGTPASRSSCASSFFITRTTSFSVSSASG